MEIGGAYLFSPTAIDFQDGDWEDCKGQLHGSCNECTRSIDCTKNEILLFFDRSSGSHKLEEIEIEGKVLRAGKAVGVVAVELRRKHSGKIIAQGRHTKYLAASSRL